MDRARAVCPWTPSLGGTDRSVCSPHYGSVKRLRIFEYLTSLSFQLRPHLSHFNLTENFVTRERQDGDDDDDDDDDESIYVCTTQTNNNNRENDTRIIR